jgi:pyruvate dehydrogenase E1 component alpha subunit
MPLKEVGAFSVSYLQILDEAGQVDHKLAPKLEPEQLREIYRWMVLAREADQRMLKLQRQGRMGTFPLCTGQEAAACGAAYAMEERDWFVGSYRELAGRLVRGQSLLQHMRYWNGFEEGNRHPEKGRLLPVAAIIASHLLHAVGVGYAAKLREERSAVVTFFGDGATSEGDFHEALNFAGVWQVPVVFICLNNGWAISQPREAQTHCETIAQKAIGYGFEGIQVDGNDVLAVYRATKAALERARQGGGPTLIEAMTYRLMMHTTADDPRRYRLEKEVEQWWQRDPLGRMRKYLEQLKAWDDKREQALVADCKREVEEAVKACEATQLDRPDAPFDHVFGSYSPQVERQRQDFLSHLKKERSRA